MLGNRIKQLRDERDLTQQELGKIVGVTTSSIGMYETSVRQPSYEVLGKIAEYFGVSTDYLLGRKTSGDKIETKVLDRRSLNIVEKIYTVDPEMLIAMGGIADLPVEERNKIKEYSLLLIDKHLKENKQK